MPLLVILLVALVGALVLLAAWLAWQRSPVGIARNAALDELSALQFDLSRALGWFTALDRALDAACDTWAAEHRATRLREMPIEAIKTHVDVRIRWSALRAAGIVTVHDEAVPSDVIRPTCGTTRWRGFTE